MSKPFSLDFMDEELSQRMSAPEWQRIAAFRNQPNFIAGLYCYDNLISAYFANNLILNKVVTEIWRFHTLVFALHLCDQAKPDDPRAGLTLSKLQKLCAAQEMGSAGRVLAFVGLMQIGGYLKRQRSEKDSRVVLLVATQKLMHVVEGWNQAMLQIVDTIAPGDDLAQNHISHPEFGRVMRRHGTKEMLNGFRVLDPFPEVLHFLGHDAAWMLLLRATAEVARNGRGEIIVPVSIELASFGKLYGVSRSHLRRVLDSAYDIGLLDAPPRNGSYILPSQKLVASYLTCMASELECARRWGLLAQQDLGRNASAAAAACA